jgi:DNA-directed RNA polymerase specialized sigma subunit
MSSEYLNNKIFEKVISVFQKSKREKVKYKLILEDLEEAQKRLSVRKNKSTVKTKIATLLDEKHSQYNEIVDDYQVSQTQLAEAFYTLSENIARYAKFSFIDIDDAVQEGVLICFEKIDRFDPDKGKAFNYMTTCVLNHFRQLYRSARHYNDLKKKYSDFIQSQVERTLLVNRRNITKKKNKHYLQN